MTTISRKRHSPSACAWCGLDFLNVLELLLHVDDSHVDLPPGSRRVRPLPRAA